VRPTRTLLLHAWSGPQQLFGERPHCKGKCNGKCHCKSMAAETHHRHASLQIFSCSLCSVRKATYWQWTKHNGFLCLAYASPKYRAVIDSLITQHTEANGRREVGWNAVFLAFRALLHNEAEGGVRQTLHSLDACACLPLALLDIVTAYAGADLVSVVTGSILHPAMVRWLDDVFGHNEQAWTDLPWRAGNEMYPFTDAAIEQLFQSHHKCLSVPLRTDGDGHQIGVHRLHKFKRAVAPSSAVRRRMTTMWCATELKHGTTTETRRTDLSNKLWFYRKNAWTLQSTHNGKIVTLHLTLQ
jgi:hypothetical protein